MGISSLKDYVKIVSTSQIKMEWISYNFYNKLYRVQEDHLGNKELRHKVFNFLPKLPKIDNHQYENIITYIDKIYKESFNKFIYFLWIVKSIVPMIQGIFKSIFIVSKKNAKSIGQCKFVRV